ncbi:transposase [Bacteroidia bacterium]|nr:transposase [Bacteroidia bacterium]
MSNKTISMLQIRRLLQLLEERRSKRFIAKELGVSRNTVDSYEEKILASGLSFRQLLESGDSVLSGYIYGNGIKQSSDSRQERFASQTDYFFSELKKVGVTRQLLWKEYKLSDPEGYGYTQFCDHLKAVGFRSQATMHLEHAPGERLQVDFAGKQLSYVDARSGEKINCPVLVCSLPYSGYAYVEALRDATGRSLYEALGRCLRYIGGVPQNILSDNMKQYVIKANRYEPSFNDMAEQWAVYYNTTLSSTRVRKPKDKPSVEKEVHISYLRVFAPLRNEIFYSLQQLNQRIMDCLDIHNQTPMQRQKQSREERFSGGEKPFLKPLPRQDFIVRNETKAKVQRNYHVILGEDMHQYSVPYIHTGKEVKIIYDYTEVEIFLGFERIALHHRNPARNGYTTKEEHMPESHQYYRRSKGWDADYFLREGSRIGENTQSVINRLLGRRRFPEQTYNACLGILSLGKRYGNERLEAACKKAMTVPVTTYQIVRNILQNNQDKLDTQESHPVIPLHGNIRGKEAYK